MVAFCFDTVLGYESHPEPGDRGWITFSVIFIALHTDTVNFHVSSGNLRVLHTVSSPWGFHASRMPAVCQRYRYEMTANMELLCNCRDSPTV